jgi:hypothetical protein
MTADHLKKVQTALAAAPRTTAQLAIACKWTLDTAFANMVALEQEGLVARDSARPVNSAAVMWRLTSADALTAAIEQAAEQECAMPPQPEAPSAPAWAASTDAPKSVPRSTKRAVPVDDGTNPYQAPAPTETNATENDALVERQKRFEAKGNFWLGFVAGVFIGPIAYLLTTSSAPQTNRGASWGAATQIVVFVGWRLLLG